MIARRLAAQADLGAGLVRFAMTLSIIHLTAGSCSSNSPDSVSESRSTPRVKLGQVVRADREAVEALGELLRQNDVGGDLAHHIDLQPVLAALQAVFAPSPRAPGRPRSIDRQNGIIMTMTLSKPISSRSALDRPAFERKTLAVARRIIARGAAEADHRVFLVRLELGAAEQAGIFVGLEIAHAHDDRLGMNAAAMRASPRDSRSTKYSGLSS